MCNGHFPDHAAIALMLALYALGVDDYLLDLQGDDHLND